MLPATTQGPARLVDGSAALVASLRGQQSHFATLPINETPMHSFDPPNIFVSYCQRGFCNNVGLATELLLLKREPKQYIMRDGITIVNKKHSQRKNDFIN